MTQLLSKPKQSNKNLLQSRVEGKSILDKYGKPEDIDLDDDDDELLEEKKKPGCSNTNLGLGK